MIFAWVRDFANRPVAQVWPEIYQHEKERTLATHALPEGEHDLPLDVLRRLYPAPAPKEASR